MSKLNTETFHITISETRRGMSWKRTLIEEYDFLSDNVFKDSAKIMMDLMKPDGLFHNYSNGLYIRIENLYGEEEHFLLVHTRDGGFIRYASNESESFSNGYIDYDVEPQYLTCIDDESNEYKYYLMTLSSDYCDKFIAEYGRIGGRPNDNQYNMNKEGSHQYPAQMFWVKYYEKLSKGYQVNTELRNFDNVKSQLDTEYEPIDDENVKKLIDILITNQREYVQAHYDLKIPFSEKAVNNAQSLLNQVTDIANHLKENNISATEQDSLKLDFIKKYKELLVTLPRRIDNVALYVNSVDFFDTESPRYVDKVLESERDLLDNFIDLHFAEKKAEAEKPALIHGTVLDKFGLSAQTVDFAEKFMVMDSMGSEAYKLSNVIAVQNQKTQQAYEECKRRLHIEDKDCHLFWHGSRTENWWSIFKNGMSLNPNAVITGKMFGNGLYFAPLCKKSMGYIDLQGSYWAGGTKRTGYLALFEVAMGRSYKPTHSLPSNFDYLDLDHNCQSVWAYPSKTGLKNEECIIYREEQCNIKYLVEVSADRILDYSFSISEARKFRFTDPRIEDNKIIVNVPNFKTCMKNCSCRKVRFEYDLDTKDLSFVNAIPFTRIEKEYITDIFMSKFADSEPEFRIIADEIKEKGQIPSDIVKRLIKENQKSKEGIKEIVS